MPPSSYAVAATTPIKGPASSCHPPVSWSHRPPSWLLVVFTEPGPITALLATELLECLPPEDLVTAPQGRLLREPLAMEPPVEEQTSMAVSIGLVAVNRSALAPWAGSAWKCCSRGCRVIASYGSYLSSSILVLVELRGRRQLGVLITSREGMALVLPSAASQSPAEPDRRLQAPPVKGINAAKQLLIGIAWPVAAIDQHP